jgi:hypothetical protein
MTNLGISWPRKSQSLDLEGCLRTNHEHLAESILAAQIHPLEKPADLVQGQVCHGVLFLVLVFTEPQGVTL